MSNPSFSAEPSRPRSPWWVPAIVMFEAATLFLFLLIPEPERFAILHESLFRQTAIGVGLSMLVPFAFLAWRLLDGSRNTRGFLIIGLLLALPGFPLFSLVAMRAVNIHLDFEQPRIYELHDVSIERVSVGRYTLRTPNWPAAVFKPHELRLTAAEYRVLRGKDQAILFIGPGALGYEWVQQALPMPRVE